MTGVAAAQGSLSSALLPAPVRIRSVTRETLATFTWTLNLPEHAPSFTFAPGQFNVIYAFGVGEVAISLSGDPAATDAIVHTIREVGAVTRALGKLRTGDVVGVRGPYGRPWPVDAARGRDLLLIAGGLGLAPLRPALLHALAHRGDYGHVTLVYGARSPDELLFPEQLSAWAQRGDLEVLVTVDHADQCWTGQVGVVPALLRQAHFDPARVTAMVCGPEVMLRFVRRELDRMGVGDDDVYVSLERNMKCAVGFCGRCQLGPAFVCKDGPVFAYREVRSLLATKEL